MPRPTHKLKTLPEYFEAVLSGKKTFEIRENTDRDFRCGDKIVLREFTGERYTGREAKAAINYITDFEQKEGFIVFGFSLDKVKGSPS